MSSENTPFLTRRNQSDIELTTTYTQKPDKPSRASRVTTMTRDHKQEPKTKRNEMDVAVAGESVLKDQQAGAVAQEPKSLAESGKTVSMIELAHNADLVEKAELVDGAVEDLGIPRSPDQATPEMSPGRATAPPVKPARIPRSKSSNLVLERSRPSIVEERSRPSRGELERPLLPQHDEVEASKTQTSQSRESTSTLPLVRERGSSDSQASTMEIELTPKPPTWRERISKLKAGAAKVAERISELCTTGPNRKSLLISFAYKVKSMGLDEIKSTPIRISAKLGVGVGARLVALPLVVLDVAAEVLGCIRVIPSRLKQIIKLGHIKVLTNLAKVDDADKYALLKRIKAVALPVLEGIGRAFATVVIYPIGAAALVLTKDILVVFNITSTGMKSKPNKLEQKIENMFYGIINSELGEAFRREVLNRISIQKGQDGIVKAHKKLYKSLMDIEGKIEPAEDDKLDAINLASIRQQKANAFDQRRSLETVQEHLRILQGQRENGYISEEEFQIARDSYLAQSHALEQNYIETAIREVSVYGSLISKSSGRQKIDLEHRKAITKKTKDLEQALGEYSGELTKLGRDYQQTLEVVELEKLSGKITDYLEDKAISGKHTEVVQNYAISRFIEQSLEKQQKRLEVAGKRANSPSANDGDKAAFASIKRSYESYLDGIRQLEEQHNVNVVTPRPPPLEPVPPPPSEGSPDLPTQDPPDLDSP